MRLIMGCMVSLMATSAWADNFEIQSTVSDVIASPAGGIITRAIPVTLPAGQHRLTVLGAQMVDGDVGNGIDFPVGSGLSLIASSSKAATAKEPLYLDTADYKSLKQSVDAAQRSLHAHQTVESAQTAIVEAAKIRLTFVKQFATGANTVLSLEQLSDPLLISNLTTQLGDEAAKAVVEHAQADRKLQTLRDKGRQLSEALNRAQARLSEFLPANREEMVLSLEISASKPFTGEINLRHLSDAVYWEMISDIELSQTQATGALRISQQAFLQQGTGEDWDDVNVTLSTVDLSRASGVDLPGSLIKKLYDPSKNKYPKSIRAESLAVDARGSADIAMARVEEPGPSHIGTSFAGQTQIFALKTPLDIPTGETLTKIPLQEIDMDVDLYARATASVAKAYLYADVTNETGGRILPSTASLYRDGQFFGQFYMPELVAGDEHPLQLGVIDGLLVDHNILKKEDGDRGLLSSSQIAQSRFETVIASTLDYDIPFKLFSNMPVSESEDLIVKEYAKPAISERGIEGRRGVVVWALDITAGQTQKVEYGYDLSWPSGMAVR